MAILGPCKTSVFIQVFHRPFVLALLHLLSGEKNAEGFGQTIIKAARSDTAFRTNLGRGRLCLRQMLMQVRGWCVGAQRLLTWGPVSAPPAKPARTL
jgi:hypothetical protein